MSTSGISNSLYSSNIQSQMLQFQKEFAQLGKDLSSGDLSEAQSDYVTLQSSLPQASSSSASTSQSNNPMVQAFDQLSKDLQSGNLSAAKQDYSTIQQDFQSQASKMHHHHHHKSGESQESQVSALLDQLGQDLQSSNLSNAQSDFNSLLQFFQSKTSSYTSSGSTSAPASTSASASTSIYA